MAGLPNLYSVIDGLCTLKVENISYTENINTNFAQFSKNFGSNTYFLCLHKLFYLKQYTVNN